VNTPVAASIVTVTPSSVVTLVVVTTMLSPFTSESFGNTFPVTDVFTFVT
jgi:hypothetical protein